MRFVRSNERARIVRFSFTDNVIIVKTLCSWHTLKKKNQHNWSCVVWKMKLRNGSTTSHTKWIFLHRNNTDTSSSIVRRGISYIHFVVVSSPAETKPHRLTTNRTTDKPDSFRQVNGRRTLLVLNFAHGVLSTISTYVKQPNCRENSV